MSSGDKNVPEKTSLANKVRTGTMRVARLTFSRYKTVLRALSLSLAVTGTPGESSQFCYSAGPFHLAAVDACFALFLSCVHTGYPRSPSRWH